MYLERIIARACAKNVEDTKIAAKDMEIAAKDTEIAAKVWRLQQRIHEDCSTA